ncbi:MAG: HPF/RaiA family ribosome-associated protein [Vicinamibacterales bacterium]
MGAWPGALARFGERITRVEVHFTDENSSAKSNDFDKRCAIEARLAGLPPIAVTHQAAGVEQALAGALDKLTRSVDRALGRIKDAHLRDSPRT